MVKFWRTYICTYKQSFFGYFFWRNRSIRHNRRRRNVYHKTCLHTLDKPREQVEFDLKRPDSIWNLSLDFILLFFNECPYIRPRHTFFWNEETWLFQFHCCSLQKQSLYIFLHSYLNNGYLIWCKWIYSFIEVLWCFENGFCNIFDLPMFFECEWVDWGACFPGGRSIGTVPRSRYGPSWFYLLFHLLSTFHFYLWLGSCMGSRGVWLSSEVAVIKNSSQIGVRLRIVALVHFSRTLNQYSSHPPLSGLLPC